MQEEVSYSNMLQETWGFVRGVFPKDTQLLSFRQRVRLFLLNASTLFPGNDAIRQAQRTVYVAEGSLAAKYAAAMQSKMDGKRVLFENYFRDKSTVNMNLIERALWPKHATASSKQGAALSLGGVKKRSVENIKLYVLAHILTRSLQEDKALPEDKALQEDTLSEKDMSLSGLYQACLLKYRRKEPSFSDALDNLVTQLHKHHRINPYKLEQEFRSACELFLLFKMSYESRNPSSVFHFPYISTETQYYHKFFSRCLGQAKLSLNFERRNSIQPGLAWPETPRAAPQLPVFILPALPTFSNMVGRFVGPLCIFYKTIGSLVWHSLDSQIYRDLHLGWCRCVHKLADWMLTPATFANTLVKMLLFTVMPLTLPLVFMQGLSLGVEWLMHKLPKRKKHKVVPVSPRKVLQSLAPSPSVVRLTQKSPRYSDPNTLLQRECKSHPVSPQNQGSLDVAAAPTTARVSVAQFNVTKLPGTPSWHLYFFNNSSPLLPPIHLDPSAAGWVTPPNGSPRVIKPLQLVLPVVSSVSGVTP